MTKNREATYRIVGSILRRIRTDANISMATLAEILQQENHYISQIESGMRRVGVVDFIDIVSAMGKDPAEVLEMCNQQLRAEGHV